MKMKTEWTNELINEFQGGSFHCIENFDQDHNTAIMTFEIGGVIFKNIAFLEMEKIKTHEDVADKLQWMTDNFCGNISNWMVETREELEEQIIRWHKTWMDEECYFIPTDYHDVQRQITMLEGNEEFNMGIRTANALKRRTPEKDMVIELQGGGSIVVEGWNENAYDFDKFNIQFLNHLGLLTGKIKSLTKKELLPLMEIVKAGKENTGD